MKKVLLSYIQKKSTYHFEKNVSRVSKILFWHCQKMYKILKKVSYCIKKVFTIKNDVPFERKIPAIEKYVCDIPKNVYTMYKMFS